MKKLFVLSAAALLAVGLVGCSNEANDPAQPADPAPQGEVQVATGAKAVIDSLYAGMNEGDYPMYEVQELDAATFEGFTNVAYPEGIKAYTGDALIGSIAHSVVLVEKTGDVDLEALKTEMLEKANPRKWVCVEAEKVEAKINGDYLLLIMSSEDMTDKMMANFDKVGK